MMFAVKKVVGRLLFPVPVCLALLLAGLVLLWFTRRQRTGKALVTLGTGLLAVLSLAPVSEMLLWPLEAQYPPVEDARAAGAEGGRPVRWVVVLDGGYYAAPWLPLSARPSGPTLTRLVEGVRLYRDLPGCKLVLSVGSTGEADEEPRARAGLVRVLGVPDRDVILETGARDTDEEADLVRRTVGDEPFFLVTSASHMPRALAQFRGRGMDPVPAPTEYHATGENPGAAPTRWVPSARHLLKSERALYEYLGRAWSAVRP